MRVIVVGTGIAGVTCARELVARGVDVRVLERSRGVGGRLAVHRHDGRPADIGAAYFTVSDPDFDAQVAGWREAGLARPWTDRLSVFEGERPADPTTGPMRWAAPNGLRSLVEDMADGLEIETGRTVERVEPGPRVVSTTSSRAVGDGSEDRAAGSGTTGGSASGGGASGSGASGSGASGSGAAAGGGFGPGAAGTGRVDEADAVVVAMPDPQAARIIDPGSPAAAEVAGREWNPVLALTAGYPERSWPDITAAFVNDHPTLSLVADDGARRGDGAPVLVAHSTGEVARRYDADPAAAAPEMVDAVARLLELSHDAEWTHVHRWRFAAPAASREATFHLGDDGIALAGDGWGRSRVQTAYLSGLHLARALTA